MANQPATGFAVASLVLGILSIIFCWVPFLGIIMGVLGIVFYVQQRKISENGMATGGLITSIVGLAFSAIYTLLWIFIFSVATTAVSVLA